MISLESTDEGVLVLLDVDAENLSACCDALLDALERRGNTGGAHTAEIRERMHAAADTGPAALAHHVGLLSAQLETPGEPVQALMRLRKPMAVLGEEPVWFLWVLFSNEHTHVHMHTAAEFANLIADDVVLERFLAAPSAAALFEAYDEALDREIHFEGHIPEELRPSGRLGGGLINDIKRRLPHYVSDYTDGLKGKSLASILFLYFACLAPAVAFGGLLSVKTNGEVGAIEMIVATAICGVVYAIFSAQPLTILGSTGPVIIFMGILYTLCESLAIPFLPTAACVGLWTTLFLLVLAVTDASCWIRYFTRFTDETFAALIALIFIYEAVSDMVGGFSDPEVSSASALLSLNMALGTFIIAMALKRFRGSPYMLRPIREFFSDFGPAIALVAMAGLTLFFREISLETLAVPEQFGTSTGRGWLVNPMDAPPWVWGASVVPAILVSVLLYLDQNITVRLVNNPEFKLKKGAGYHLDLALVGVLVGVCSLLGLPWMVAATVRSLNHVRSLAETESEGGRESVISVLETRVTGVGVHALVGASLLALPLLKLMPMSVLFGLFLFMGVAAMGGNQYFERLRLWAMDPEQYPPTYYLRAVPTRNVHRFTGIQSVCLAVLWVVKTSAVGILFPLFIGLLVPVRIWMERWFEPEDLALLDAEEEPEDERDREGA